MAEIRFKDLNKKKTYIEKCSNNKTRTVKVLEREKAYKDENGNRIEGSIYVRFTSEEGRKSEIWMNADATIDVTEE